MGVAIETCVKYSGGPTRITVAGVVVVPPVNAGAGAGTVQQYYSVLVLRTQLKLKW
jgi:hypothetical protein